MYPTPREGTTVRQRPSHQRIIRTPLGPVRGVGLGEGRTEGVVDDARVALGVVGLAAAVAARPSGGEEIFAGIALTRHRTSNSLRDSPPGPINANSATPA